MLYCHVTTQNLIPLQPDLADLLFRNVPWQYGRDGVLTTDGAFTAANLRLYKPNTLGETQELSTDPNFNALDVLNIKGNGFFHVKTITSNVACTLAMVPGVHDMLNMFASEEYDDETFTEITSGGVWSFGGWESQIMAAHIELLHDVYAAKVDLTGLDDDDPSYNMATCYKALELINTSLITDPNGYHATKANRYKELYTDIMRRIEPASSDGTQAPPGEWQRA